MVLGMAAKNRKGGVVQVNYLVLVQDIKPWPPSQSLRSLRSVMIQWENGEKSSGSTNTVVPTIGSVVGEGKIEFNESFRLPVSLVRESVKGRDADTFQKNCLEFNLYEPRRDKAQLLASAVVDLADYGILKETLSISVPMNCKRSFKNTDQPILSIKIEPIVKGRTSYSSKGGLLKEASLDRNGSGSVSALMNEEYLEEAEIASFTDDDVSSQSAMTVSSSTLEADGGLPPQHEEEISKETAWGMAQENLKERSSQLPSTGISSDLESSTGGHSSISNCHNSSSPLLNSVVTHNIHSTSSSIAGEFTDVQADGSLRNSFENSSQLFQEKIASNGTAVRSEIHRQETVPNGLQFEVASPNCNDSSLKLASTVVDGCHNSVENIDSDNPSEIDNGGQNIDEKSYSTNSPSNVYMQEVSENPPPLEKDTPHSDRGDRLKPVKSVRSSSDLVRSNGLSSNQPTEIRDGGILGDLQSGGSLRSNERKDSKVCPKDSRSASLDNKIQWLEEKLNMLEGELREAAALEAALYSVVAEHGSSISKVHAPARRLSRLYLHACREAFQSRRASVSRSIISGLILVAKACGNDVPRLTFWLSNSVLFRAIICQSIGDVNVPPSSGLTEQNVARKGKKEVSPQLKWKDSSSKRKENSNISCGSGSDWEDSGTFISALERVEGWIFSRIIESVWWQTLTPHMQLAIGNAIDRDTGSCSMKKFGRMPSSTDQEQGNFSLEHWKKAFKDACERLCPVRAGGHECGCLPMLARLIMEQCVSRLDVAMFNAILRESGDEMPTDPVSDPISNSAVLPIPAGKASFGAGAQLKNAIGNWSRWLSNLFGIDDDDIPEDEDGHENNDEGQETSFKPFHLLNALSDLMMLPKDMLLDGSVRKEVCPTFGAPLIKKVLYNFVPDEFCPDRVPDAVLEALDEEDPFEAREGSVTNHPCVAPPPAYSPPSAASVSSIIGESGNQTKLRRSRSSVVRKSYTSDDELDELNSPLSSILTDCLRSSHVQSKPSWISKGHGNPCAVRFELLRDVWMSSE